MPDPASIIIVAVALVAATLTLFTGFGLGTLLLPAFALVFTIEIAVAATAVVHLANNVFKLALVGRWSDRKTVLRFTPAAIFAAFLGAWFLSLLAQTKPLATYSLGPVNAEITPIKLIVGALILAFTVFEAIPAANRLAVPARWLPLGGAISGFFGGISGHQGALRTLFLARAGLGAKQLVGTMAVCSLAVDLARTALYSATFIRRDARALADSGDLPLVAAAIVSAFVGSFVGSRLVKKITIDSLRVVIAVALMLVGLSLVVGVV